MDVNVEAAASVDQYTVDRVFKLGINNTLHLSANNGLLITSSCFWRNGKVHYLSQRKELLEYARSLSATSYTWVPTNIVNTIVTPRHSTEEVESISKVCWESTAQFLRLAHCVIISSWDDADRRDQENYRYIVESCLARPDADVHSLRLTCYTLDGWAYGPEFDLAKKLNPCLVPFDDTPKHLKDHDSILKAIVKTFG